MSTDPFGRRVFTAPAPQAILNAMKRIIGERTAWDELPELGMLHSDTPDTVRLHPLPLPPEKWLEAGDPKRLMKSLLFLLTKPVGLGMLRASDALRLELPDTFCGMFLRNEGWAPPQHRVEAVYRARQAGSRQPRFKDMPGRVEMRMGSAVDCEGRFYMALQQRGRPGIDAACHGQNGDRVEGDVPDLLWALTRAFMAPMGQPAPDTIPDTFLSGEKGPTA